jgi:hypothetical protein
MRRVPDVLALLIPLSTAACAGEPRVIEPRTPPPHEIPSVQLPPYPPRPGEGRIVLDTTDGPMRLSMASDPSFVPPGASTAPSRAGELCLTPCVADLPFGKYRLFMTAENGEHGDTDDLLVGQGLTVYRRAPGKYTTPTIADRIAPGALLVLGITLFSVGTVLASSAAASSATGSSSGESAVPGLLLAGAGVGLGIGGGIWVYEASRAIRQRGATTTWTEPLR